MSGLAQGQNTFPARIARGALNLLFPPLCVACRAHVSDPGSLCPDCWRAISFIEGPVCSTCGLPFDLDPGGETLCGACHAKPPRFDRALSVMRYDDASKKLVLALKRADRLDLTPAFARWMERSGRSLLDEAELIVPVPLHRLRLWRRRYNQAAVIAQAIAGSSGLHYAPLLLQRLRATPSQGTMPSAKARRRNMLGAFAVPKPRRGEVKGRTVLLVDDVLTTGATLDACARSLKRAGASRVLALTLARVVRAAPGEI
ncbi:MAG TPA: ComF family protein [Rhizomicrobium sp.]|jgi:ComF family protein